jgi:hypothetical protein
MMVVNVYSSGHRNQLQTLVFVTDDEAKYARMFYPGKSEPTSREGSRPYKNNFVVAVEAC